MSDSAGSTSGKRPSGATKRCSRCGWTLPVERFYGNSRGGFRSTCKACDSERSRLYYRQHRSERLAYQNARAARLRAEEGPRPPRACEWCGRETPTRRHRYCSRCKPAADRAWELRKRSSGHRFERELEETTFKPVNPRDALAAVSTGEPVEEYRERIQAEHRAEVAAELEEWERRRRERRKRRKA